MNGSLCNHAFRKPLMEKLTTAEDFLLKADSVLKNYIEVYPVNVPYSDDLLTAFWCATRLIGPVLSRPSFVQAIIGKPPFEIPIGHHRLIFAQSDAAVATAWKGFILLNHEALRKYDVTMQTASVLEEFVHTMMAISDDHLARIVVAHLIEKVSATSTGYVLRS